MRYFERQIDTKSIRQTDGQTNYLCESARRSVGVNVNRFGPYSLLQTIHRILRTVEKRLVHEMIIMLLQLRDVLLTHFLDVHF